MQVCAIKTMGLMRKMGLECNTQKHLNGPQGEKNRNLIKMVAHFYTCMCRLKKKKAQCESCKLSFIWGKMRTIAREATFQIALKNCSKEVGGKVSTYVILAKGCTCNQAHIFCRRFLLVSRWLLLVTRNRCRHKGF